MLSIDQIGAFIEQEIARDWLAGNREELRRIQLAAGVIMRAAESIGDKETARRFQLLASQAANKQEDIANR